MEREKKRREIERKKKRGKKGDKQREEIRKKYLNGRKERKAIQKPTL